MHDVGIVLASKDEGGATHVGCQLVNLVEALIEDPLHVRLVTQIHDNEIVCGGWSEFRVFQIDAPHPKPFGLQPLYEVTTDETACAADQGLLHISKLLCFDIALSNASSNRSAM